MVLELDTSLASAKTSSLRFFFGKLKNDSISEDIINKIAVSATAWQWQLSARRSYIQESCKEAFDERLLRLLRSPEIDLYKR